MENINFKGIPTSLFLNGPNLEIVSDSQTGISIGSVTTTTTYSTPSVSTPVAFDDSQSAFISATYDTNTNRVVIAYQDRSTNYGTAVVGNVVGTGITFGTPVTFETANTTHQFSAVYDSFNQKVVIAYGENTPTGQYNAKARVGTVDPSNNSISFGSAVVFANTDIAYTDATYDSTNNKVVIAWRDQDGFDLRGKAIVGTVVGTGITFGSEIEFNSTDSHYTRITYDPTNQKVVIGYQNQQQDSNNNYTYYPTAIVGTVSGSEPTATISFGTPTTIESTIGQWITPIYDPTSQKIVIFYSDFTNSKGKAVVGTIVGTDITFGNLVIFESSPSSGVGDNSAVYDTSSNKLINTYSYGGNAQGKSFVATVVGTGITFGTAVDVGYGPYQSATYDSSNNKIVIAYRDDAGDMDGTAVVYTPSGLITNLTTENYTDVVGVATFTGIATATFKQNPTAILDGGSIDFEWYYNGSRILDVSEDVTSGAGISTFDYVTGTGSTMTITGKNSDLNGKEVYFTVGYTPSAYQSETPVTAGTARSTANAINEPLQSTIVTIGVKPEIEITNQPNSVFVPLDTAATYNIEARTIPGNGPVNYQWQLDGNDLVDGTTTTTVQELSAGKITIVSQGVTTTIDFSEVASYDQFIPGQQYILTTDRDIIVRFHLEGAAGGSSSVWPNQRGGPGGLSVGTITLSQGESYILNVGERGKGYVAIDANGTPAPGSDESGGWPGGGDSGFPVNHGSAGGGGYTGLFLSSVSQENAVIIAGGGGGGSNDPDYGGAGGGLDGNDGRHPDRSGKGGTQSAGGTGGIAVNSSGITGTNGSIGEELQGGIGGGGGGGGYYGGGGGAYHIVGAIDGAGGGGSGHINGSVVSDGTTTAGEGYTAPRFSGYQESDRNGSVRIDAISASKEATTIISGSQTNNLSITTNDSAAGVIRCRVSADIDVVESPVFSRSVSYCTSDARTIVNIEEIVDQETTANLISINLANGEYVFSASTDRDAAAQPSVIISHLVTANAEVPHTYSFYSTERDIDVEVDMYGGKGDTSTWKGIQGAESGGLGGYSRIQFTMEQNVEYVIAGLTDDTRAPFLYKKGVLMAVVGGGGDAGHTGDGNGGTGGGVDIAGSAGSGINAGKGGQKINSGDLGSNGKFGSSYSPPRLYPGDVQSGGLEGGQTIKCTKGQYWAEQGKGACDDLGSVKFRLQDGTEVTNTSSSITRGFKAGYNIMQTSGKEGVNGGAGGNGATGGDGGTGGSAGGGGGSGYQDGSVTVIDTKQGGGDEDPVRVVLRLQPTIIQPGQQEYILPGTYSWVAPAGVSLVSFLCIGGGGGASMGGGGGGALIYRNDYSVIPGNSYTVVVGSGGLSENYFDSIGSQGGDGGASSFDSISAEGGRGSIQTAAGGRKGSELGGDGGAGGNYASGGGGGAGGYSGTGGAGGAGGSYTFDNPPTDGAGGGGGGGGDAGLNKSPGYSGGGGGGVGIFGQGVNGVAGFAPVSGSNGQGGTGGSGGTNGSNPPSQDIAGNGGNYGGGAGGHHAFGRSTMGGTGGGGAVRIIWGNTGTASEGRAFPSTNTGNL